MKPSLDDPIWHALTGPHAHHAIGRGAARRYPLDMCPFAAIAEPTARAYADLAADLPAGANAILVRVENETLPPGWKEDSVRWLEQKILSSETDMPVPHPAEAKTVSLGLQDAVDMQALVDICKPGPFGSRTVELGGYVGVRDSNGRLIAMAGERMRLPGFVEVSAICVHPEARGQGLGFAVTQRVARAAFARGEVPILHVWPDNPAKVLYAKIGFRLRARLWVLARRPIAERQSG